VADLIVGVPGHIAVTFTVGEEPVDAGAVTVQVSGDDGEPVAAGTVEQVETGVYRALVTADHVDLLTAVWTSQSQGERTTSHTVAGGVYASIKQIRAAKQVLQLDKITDEQIIRARAWFEALAERHCGVAFVPRYDRVLADVTHSRDLLAGPLYLRRVLWARTDGGPLEDLSGWRTTDYGAILRIDGWWHGRVELGVEHGQDAPPADLFEVAVDAIRLRVLEDRSGQSPRVTSITNEFQGTTRFAVADEDNPTGIPHVDAVLNSLREHVAVMA
jgi:hypothetical protein